MQCLFDDEVSRPSHLHVAVLPVEIGEKLAHVVLGLLRHAPDVRLPLMQAITKGLDAFTDISASSALDEHKYEGWRGD